MNIIERFAALFGGKKGDGVNNAAYSSDVYETFGVGPTSAAGISINASTAMRVSAVYACVQRIAGAVASLPLHVYERTTDGRKRVDLPIWWLLNEAPTSRYSAASHWETALANVLLRGDSFAWIRRDSFGNIREIVPLPWQVVDVVRDLSQVGGELRYYVNDSAVRTTVEAPDMLHFPGLGFDGIRSLSVIQWAARNAAGSALAMDEYAGKFFSGGAHPSIVLQTDGKMSTDQIDKLQKAFANKYGGVENAHRIPLVLTEGIKADALSISAHDAQLLEARKFQVVDIARAFGVPPHMIGETSAATSWGTGIEAMSRGFVTYTLQPHLIRIEQEINRKIWPSRAKYFVEFNRDALLEGDSKSQAEYFRAALGGPGTGPGWMTVDEIRKTKNLAPMGGDAGELFDPRVVEPAAPADPAGPTPSDLALAGISAALAEIAGRETPAPVVNVAAPVVNIEPAAPSPVTLNMDTAAIGDAIRESVSSAVTAAAGPIADSLKAATEDIRREVEGIEVVVNIAPTPPRRVEKVPVRGANGLIERIIETEIEV